MNPSGRAIKNGLFDYERRCGCMATSEYYNSTEAMIEDHGINITVDGDPHYARF